LQIAEITLVKFLSEENRKTLALLHLRQPYKNQFPALHTESTAEIFLRHIGKAKFSFKAINLSIQS